LSPSREIGLFPETSSLLVAVTLISELSLKRLVSLPQQKLQEEFLVMFSDKS
jgi:hypothetical protein